MMKSIIIMQGVAITALLLLLSCTSDDSLTEKNEKGYSITVVCDELRNEDTSTRVAIDLSTGSPTFPRFRSSQF